MGNALVIARGTEKAQILVIIQKSEMKLEILMMTGTRGNLANCLGMIKDLARESSMLTIIVDLDHAKKVVGVVAKINIASLNPKLENNIDSNTFRNFLLT